MPHSSAFERFRESFFGDPYMAWHDGLDTEALHELGSDERAEAEAMLLHAIDSGDPRVMTGLGELRSDKAVAELTRRLPGATGELQIALAVALWKIAAYPPALDYLIQNLRSRQFWSVRMDAAIALANLSGASDAALRARAEQALVAALSDPEDLVRNHAAESLLTLHARDPADPPYHDLCIAVMSDNRAHREAAVAALLAALKQTEGPASG